MRIADCRLGGKAQKTPAPERYAAVRSPLGPLCAVFSGRGLCRLSVGGEPPASARRVEAGEDEAAGQLADELARYFAGAREPFRTTLDLRSGTPFQRRVWAALRRIPFGHTASYADVARRIRSPRAARAVGQAVGANPVPILVPCHRVIRASGALGGFSAGLPIKRWLLHHEQRHA